MSFFTDASFVMDPSVYRAGTLFVPKPTDGSGDLTFTRSSGATRVGPNGYIEKVRTNYILQSNTFSSWSLEGGTITGGFSDPDGGLTAYKYVQTTGGLYSNIAATDSLPKITSIYLKSVDGTSYNVNLSNGSAGNITTATVTPTWQRFTNADTAASTRLALYIYAIGNVGGVMVWHPQAEYGDVATDYIPTTTTAVTVGPVANIPRLDYFGDNCPKLLLEPQRTNDVFNNTALNNYTATRATWGVNVAISPTGDQDAEKLIEDTTASNSHFFSIGANYISGTAYTWSIYVKADGRDEMVLQAGNQSVLPLNCLFNLSTQTVSNLGSGTAAIIDAGNGWYRLVVRNVVALSTAGTNFSLFLRSGGSFNYTGNGTSGVLVWGVQREVGAYETSLIPTLSTSVTRNADAASKTGASSFIGQTEGTLFAEVDIQSWVSGERILGISGGTTDNSVVLQKGTAVNTLRTISRLSNVLQVTIQSSAISGNTFKLAVAYKANDFVFYVNGVQIGTSTSASVPACSAVYLGKLESVSESSQLNGRISQALLFKTRLSNADLARLTSI
jgi:hypothetical protein